MGVTAAARKAARGSRNARRVLAIELLAAARRWTSAGRS